ncbi:S1C family serine protease [Streptomyces sp. NPDC101160]|uniref:S1C family serine protease n=1 Tax=Streptomyces sp. NPDC101160 TaxID=3366118 RepID=UPI00380EEA30
MKNGKPTWWSRPSTTSTGTPADTPAGPSEPATDDSDFTLAAPASAPVDVTKSEPVEPAGAVEPAAAPVEPETEAEAPVVQPGAPAVAPEPVPEAVAAPAPEAPPVAAHAPVAEAAPAHVPVTPQTAPQAPQAPQAPLHAPDPYATPPYGEPGPWAPAPPVQRPVPPPAPAAAAVPPAGPVPPATPAYDPWGAQPLAPAEGSKAPRKPRRGLALAGALAFALVTGVIGGGVGAYIERNGGLTTVELPQADAKDIGRAPDSVAGIAAKALPSVVTIHVSGSGSSGTGTGFVLDTSGHILTNNHVVDAAASSGEISVTFSNGESAAAKLIGRDTGYDLAVIRVSGVSGLKPLPLGNSENVRVGDPVVAIGAPFDLSNTVTSGIISAKERPITAGGEKGDGSDVSYVDALQTDAPINPGNSGGPLVDTNAEVIGINSAIRAAGNGSGGEGGGGQAGSIGLGFAIPINQGKRVAEELINTGKATHPVIGVSLDMRYTGDGARVGDKAKGGTSSVTPGGPADKAGIEPGDIITKVDGQRVHSGEELIVKIRSHRPGDTLELTLTRNGKEQTKTLTLGSSTGA